MHTNTGSADLRTYSDCANHARLAGCWLACLLACFFLSAKKACSLSHPCTALSVSGMSSLSVQHANSFTWHAAYGSSATHMVTDEALAERKAALEGDPGTDNAVKVDMPQTPSMHQAQPVEQPDQPLDTRVSTSCSCQQPRGITARLMLMACLLLSFIFAVAYMGCSLAIQMCLDLALSGLMQCWYDCCVSSCCRCSWYRASLQPAC